MRIEKSWEHFENGALKEKINQTQEELRIYMLDNNAVLQENFWQSVLSLGNKLNHPACVHIHFSLLLSSLLTNDTPIFLIEAMNRNQTVLGTGEYNPFWWSNFWYSLRETLKSEVKKYVKNPMNIRLDRSLIIVSQRYLNCVEPSLRETIREKAKDDSLKWLSKEGFKITIGCYGQKQELLYYNGEL